MKSVDTRDLKSLGEIHAGSSPATRTKTKSVPVAKNAPEALFFYFQISAVT